MARKRRWGRDVDVVVTGSRSATDTDRTLVHADLDALASKHSKKRIVVHHGGAKGIDAYAGEWANQPGRRREKIYRADWSRGRAAGPVRNETMLTTAVPKYVYAYPRGESKGTKDTIRRAKSKGLRVVEKSLADLGEISKTGTKKAAITYSVARNLHGDGDDYVEAHSAGRNIGYLRLSETGQINHIKVAKKYRRQGVATGLLREAQRLGYKPTHTEVLSRQGAAWRRAVGG